MRRIKWASYAKYRKGRNIWHHYLYCCWIHLLQQECTCSCCRAAYTVGESLVPLLSHPCFFLLLPFAGVPKLLLSSNSAISWGSLLSTPTLMLHSWPAMWILVIEFCLSFPSSPTQDSVQQRWCGGQGDREGSSGGGLWDMWQGFRWADCSALCWTYHCHQDLPEHHRAHHQLPQQDQTGRKERLLYKNGHWTKLNLATCWHCFWWISEQWL